MYTESSENDSESDNKYEVTLRNKPLKRGGSASFEREEYAEMDTVEIYKAENMSASAVHSGNSNYRQY